MTLALYLTTKRKQQWLEHLQLLLPDLKCRLWDDIEDPDAVLYVVAWAPPDGWLATFPNLQCIISIGAGIDHILQDTQCPDVPIIRTTGADLTLRMREYICLHVLRHHRRLADTQAAQTTQQWQNMITPTARQRQVGIMGLGKLGTDAARCLSMIGFNVTGWATKQHQIAGVTTYSKNQLGEFLQGCEILVCLLPLTPSTRNLLNKELFAKLPKDACIINAARGEHLVEQDLLEALETGHVGHATLDVFREEPLPAAHPFWTHPKILVTPHIASMIDPEAGGREIANNLTAFINGETIEDLTDPGLGY